MGLVTSPKHRPERELNKQELEFIVAKLKDANYKGAEFEMYFNVLKKITDYIKTLS